jgi:pyruvate carboxylase
VVGDLASFMVSNKYSKKDVLERASEINFPKSIVEFLQGYLGQPVGGTRHVQA